MGKFHPLKPVRDLLGKVFKGGWGPWNNRGPNKVTPDYHPPFPGQYPPGGRYPGEPGRH